jgi:hypothetical protein
MELDLGLPLLPREQPSNISFQVIWKIWTGGNHGSFKSREALAYGFLAARRKSKINYIVIYSVFAKRTQL